MQSFSKADSEGAPEGNEMKERNKKQRERNNRRQDSVHEWMTEGERGVR